MAKRTFTNIRVDDSSGAELVALYKKVQDKLLYKFDQQTDFARARRLSLLAEINKELKTLAAKTQVWVDTNIPKAYKVGMSDAVAGMSKLIDKGLLPNDAVGVKASFTVPNKRAAAALIDDTSKAFGDTLTLIGKNVQSITTQAFQKQVRSQLAEGVLTGERRKEIVSAVKQQLKDQGITVFKDKGGNTWSLDRYADMLTRTKLAEARNTGLANKMLENGQDLVQVSINGSDHQACADWEGVVLSVSGNNSDYDSVDDATADGLFHPNCRHTLNPVEPALARETYGWNSETGEYEQGILSENDD